jgi:hypothetical protein
LKKIFPPKFVSQKIISSFVVLNDYRETLFESLGLRFWRVLRGLRDVTFGDPGPMGIELDEPNLDQIANADGSPGDNMGSRLGWMLNATHPPASVLGLREGSELVAYNHTAVNYRTNKRELCAAFAKRPLSLTFRVPANTKKQAPLPPPVERIAMCLSECVVAHSRETAGKLKLPKPEVKVVDAKTNLENKMRDLVNNGCAVRDGIISEFGCFSVFLSENKTKDEAIQNRLFPFYNIMLMVGDAGSIANVAATCRIARVLCRTKCFNKNTPQMLLLKWSIRYGDPLGFDAYTGFWRFLVGRGVISTSNPSNVHRPGQANNDEDVLTSLFRSRAATSINFKVPNTDSKSKEAEPEKVYDTQDFDKEYDRQGASGAFEVWFASGGHFIGLPLAASLCARIANGSVQAEYQGEVSTFGTTLLPEDLVRTLFVEFPALREMWNLSPRCLPAGALLCRHFLTLFIQFLPNLNKAFAGEGVAIDLFFAKWCTTLFMFCHHIPILERHRIVSIFLFEKIIRYILSLIQEFFRRNVISSFSSK